MNQPTTFWDPNLTSTLVGGIIALAASAMPLIFAIRYDPHKTELDEHYRYLHLMTALLNEIDYIKFLKSRPQLLSRRKRHFAPSRSLLE